LLFCNAERKILQSGPVATVKGFVPEKKFAELNEKVTNGCLKEKFGFEK
jgi:hypothetical protein